MVNKQYAIVTGAASGIGRSIVNCLLSKGVYVFALDKNEFDINNVECIKCDVSSENEVEKTLKYINKHTKRIDYMVLAAGILCYEGRYLIEDIPLIEWNSVINTNLTGTLLCLKYFVPLLKNNKIGSVVTYSSEQVIKPIKKSAPYLVSKTAIESLTRLAALEYLDNRIRVNCIRAATVDTEFLSSLVKESDIREEMKKDMDDKMPYGIISAEEIAEFTWVLMSDLSSKITGQIITIDSGTLL